jgi:hypothetical protein
MVAYGKLQFRPDAKGVARITQIDAPPDPKVAQFFKEMPQRERRLSRTGRNCFNVLRTA